LEEKELEIIYWIILIVWSIVAKVSKKDSGATLKVAFVLFLVSALLTILNIKDLAETVMRVSFIGWLIGLFQALREYIKQNK
jgi:hypothetical protein